MAGLSSRSQRIWAGQYLSEWSYALATPFTESQTASEKEWNVRTERCGHSEQVGRGEV